MQQKALALHLGVVVSQREVVVLELDVAVDLLARVVVRHQRGVAIVQLGPRRLRLLKSLQQQPLLLLQPVDLRLASGACSKYFQQATKKYGIVAQPFASSRMAYRNSILTLVNFLEVASAITLRGNMPSQ